MTIIIIRKTIEAAETIKKSKIIKKLFCLMAIISLCSCATSHHKDFECKANKGMACKSVSEVNSHLNKGKIAQSKQLRIWIAPDHKLGELEGSYQYLDEVEVSR